MADKLAKPFFRVFPKHLFLSAFALGLTAIVSLPPAAHANTLGTLSITPDDASAADSSSLLGGTSGQGNITANRTMAIMPGDTLDGVLTRIGISASQRQAALKAMAELYDINQIKAGDQIEVSMRASLNGSGATHLVALQLRPAYKGNLAIVAGADGAFHRLGTRLPSAVKHSQTVSVGITTRTGSVHENLADDLAAAKVPADVAEDVIIAFAADPEIPATPSIGSRFTVVYETSKTKSGITHVMRYADLDMQGNSRRVYRYETNDGNVAFMEETGRGVVPMALAAPIRNARITSPFGWRIHPVLKVRKFHNGTDFAAPKGTPIYAAEDGVIQSIGWRGNYGRYIKIVHNDRVATTYGHMSGFAKGLKNGSRVKKGQVIAYVGSSGLSTGNHLYFEVLVDNKHVDPARSEVMLDVNLDGSSLVSFRTYVARLSESQN
tara:strand:- start:30401 stop:31711 length:1311 start_codon:yes stop_codon:yes gene_type:complete